LDKTLEMSYVHATGQRLTILAICIDSRGHRTTHVYEYARRHAGRRVYAIIGMDGQRPIISSASQRRWGVGERECPLYTVGADAAKALIISRLSLTEKGPGYVHLPHVDWCDEEFAAQLTSERLMTRFERGVPVQSWKKIRARNEILDCAVYAIAALRMIAPIPVRLVTWMQQLRATAGPSAKGAPVEQQKPAAAPSPHVRRIARSGYLGQ
jgi:phage terminase large subunit GpA-like protein